MLDTFGDKGFIFILLTTLAVFEIEFIPTNITAIGITMTILVTMLIWIIVRHH